MKQFIVILLVTFLFASCKNDDLTKVAPEVPPVETMFIALNRWVLQPNQIQLLKQTGFIQQQLWVFGI